MAHDFKKFPELTNSQMQFYYFESPHKQITEDFNARVVKVHDGDTIKVKWRERDFNFPVRLARIGAPELKESGGLESKMWLKNLIEGREVDILIDPSNRVGKWGRIIGEIMFFGMNINNLSKDLGFSQDFDNLNLLWGDF